MLIHIKYDHPFAKQVKNLNSSMLTQYLVGSSIYIRLKGLYFPVGVIQIFFEDSPDGLKAHSAFNIYTQLILHFSGGYYTLYISHGLLYGANIPGGKDRLDSGLLRLLLGDKLSGFTFGYISSHHTDFDFEELCASFCRRG